MLIQNNIHETYIKFDGCNIYTKAYNYSPEKTEAIIYLHCLGGKHSDVAFLCDCDNPYMTISIDLIGHGNSDDCTDISWYKHFGIINTIIKTFRLNRVYLVGHSIGADISLMYAKQYPEHVEKVILIDRAYYNYSDMTKFNFTKDFYKILEYNQSCGVDYAIFCNYLDMVIDNDITQAYDINVDTLLIAADPVWVEPQENEKSIADIVSDVKRNYKEYGFSYAQVSKLPDMTNDDLYSYAEFMNERINIFNSLNGRFNAIVLPYRHDMVYDENAKSVLYNKVLEFIK